MMSVGRIGCALWPWSYYMDIFALQKNNVFQRNNGLVTCKWWPAPSAPFVQWWLLTTASSIYVWSPRCRSTLLNHGPQRWRAARQSSFCVGSSSPTGSCFGVFAGLSGWWGLAPRCYLGHPLTSFDDVANYVKDERFGSKMLQIPRRDTQQLRVQVLQT